MARQSEQCPCEFRRLKRRLNPRVVETFLVETTDDQPHAAAVTLKNIRISQRALRAKMAPVGSLSPIFIAYGGASTDALNKSTKLTKVTRSLYGREPAGA